MIRWIELFLRSRAPELCFKGCAGTQAGYGTVCEVPTQAIEQPVDP